LEGKGMRTTGIVRKVDELGRIVIPKETRDLLSIQEGDSMEIFYSESSIILKKYSPGCVFCNNMEEIRQFNGMNVCKKCQDELKKLA